MIMTVVLPKQPTDDRGPTVAADPPVDPVRTTRHLRPKHAPTARIWVAEDDWSEAKEVRRRWPRLEPLLNPNGAVFWVDVSR
jgi:hypothetical protein